MTDWLVPEQDVVRIVDAAPTPLVQVSPDGRRLLTLSYRALPPLAQLAEPMLGLAGVRFHPRLHQWRRPYDFTGYTIRDLDSGDVRSIETPDGARLGRAVFSPDGRRLAFGHTTDSGVELWLGDPATGAARRLLDRKLNQTMGGSASWWAGQDALLVLLVDPRRGEPPAPPRVPPGPRAEETAGRAATHRTWADLLRTAHDEALFDHYLTGQLARVDLDPDGGPPTVTELGEPGIFLDAAVSPDGTTVLVERVLPPYPHDVPLHRFAHAIELWDGSGGLVRTVATQPVADEVPIQGVTVGPRAASWQPLEPATLVFAEALDGGDPRTTAEHRDRLLRLEAPFDGPPVETARTGERFVGLDWLERPGRALVSEWDRDRRWVKTVLHDLSGGSIEPRVVFDRSIDDRYGDPGQPVRRRTPDGSVVARMDGDAVFLVGDGATEEGDRPFLDRFDLETGEKERLFRADAERYAHFVQFTASGEGPSRDFVIRRESATDRKSV
ncbi:MAG: TolB family protein, partial [Planctomycetota bacterium JB042]